MMMMICLPGIRSIDYLADEKETHTEKATAAHER